MPEISVSGATIAHLMAHRVFDPGVAAVADTDGSHALQPLLLRAVHMARQLRRAGAGRGTYIAVAVRNRSWSAIAADYLACAWLGAVAVLSDKNELWETVGEPVHAFDRLLADGAGAGGPAASGDWPRPNDPLDVVFSSGTTGTPKPVVFRHQEWVCQPWRATCRDRVSVVHYGIPFDTSTGVHGILLQHLAAGALSAAAQSADEVADLAERYDCRELVVTPHSLRKLMRLSETTGGLTRIKTVKVVAGPITGHLAESAIEAFPNARILSIYGATELGPAVFVRLVTRGGSNVLGSPGPSSRARVVDMDGAVVPDGSIGEIQVSSGPGDVAAATDSEPTWISTGDLGRAEASGRITFVGRTKEILFLPTGRANPGEIEDSLLKHAAIEDCGVVAIDCVDGIDRLGICVVLWAPGDAEEVQATLARSEPEFDVVRFVTAIPRTALGKPVRAQLWQMLTGKDDH